MKGISVNLDATYRMQARISALEALVMELLAAQPGANAIADALEASLATQHALQISNGIPPAFANAFRVAQHQLLEDVRNRLQP